MRRGEEEKRRRGEKVFEKIFLETRYVLSGECLIK